MMGKYIKIVLAFCFMGCLVSCDDSFLDKKPLDELSDKDVWNDALLTETFINGLYSIFNYPQWGDLNEVGMSAKFIQECWSDNADLHRWPVSSVTNGHFDNTYVISGGFGYGSIRRANLAIQNLNLPNKLSETVRNRSIAEAKFIRAMLYFNKVKYYGGVPIVDKVLTLDDELNLPRSTEAECYDFIVKDLRDAAEVLPIAWESDASWGRATKGAALALKQRIELYATRYDDCIATSKQIIDLGYELEGDYASLFNNRTSFKDSKEVIMAVQYKYPGNGNIVELELSPNLTDGVIKGWGMASPTQDLVDDYLIKDEDGVARKWNESTTFIEKHPTEGVQAMYWARDWRFYATITYDGCVVKYKDSSTKVDMSIDPAEPNKSWLNEKNPGNTECNSSTGYAQRKWSYQGVDCPLPNFNGIHDQSNHWILFRLGEVYLNYAEALMIKNGDNDATALSLMNKLRVRTGLPDYKSLTFEDYKRERRVELAYELHRYWDLIRWAKIGKHASEIPEYNRTSRMIRISRDRMSYEITPIQFKAETASRKFETPKRYYFPIPLGEIIKNPNLLPNNLGWE